VQGTPLSAFTDEGLLPAGDYSMTIDKIDRSMLVVGPGPDYPNWDAAWRRFLVRQLGILTMQLWQVGVTEIFVDGSFVEAKDHPGDIDGYFVCNRQDFETGALQARLNAIDPYQVWDWSASSRRLDPMSGKRKPLMWHRYRVELFPHYGQFSGIVDEFGNQQEFPAAFRKTRFYQPKGIIRIVR